MEQIPKDQVLKRLSAENPWWREPHGIPSLYQRWAPRPYRELFLPLVRNRRVRRAVVLMGPRRVGKTVLIHHSIERLLTQVAPRRICYASVDNPVYVGAPLERFLDLYREAAGIDLQAEPCFVFLDEVQYLKDWEVHLKVLVDSYPQVKFVVSGSAAAALRRQSTESGAGRFTDFLLPPLTFHEYLALLGEEDLIATAREALAGEPLAEEEIDELNERFVHYLNYGGYPEAALSAEIQRDPGRFVKSDIIDKVLLRDLPSLYGISDIQELNALFTALAYNTAQEVSLEELAQSSGVTKPTIKRYIEYLEAAFLLRVVHRIDRSARTFERARHFKVYLTNPSMRTALFSALGAEDRELGRQVETGAFAQWFHHEDHARLHYARWRRGEIDMVSLTADLRPAWAVEVKWSDRFARQPRLLAPAIDFANRNNVAQLTVTTRRLRRRERASNVALEFVPAALYCFAVGHGIIEGDIERSQLSLFE